MPACLITVLISLCGLFGCPATVLGFSVSEQISLQNLRQVPYVAKPLEVHQCCRVSFGGVVIAAFSPPTKIGGSPSGEGRDQTMRSCSGLGSLKIQPFFFLKRNLLVDRVG